MILCYVYTGGTTRQSKCVPVTHDMALWECEHYAKALHRAQIGSQDGRGPSVVGGQRSLNKKDNTTESWKTYF
eukprot:5756611-Amphidinium_carterae.1